MGATRKTKKNTEETDGDAPTRSSRTRKTAKNRENDNKSETAELEDNGADKRNTKTNKVKLHSCKYCEKQFALKRGLQDHEKSCEKRPDLDDEAAGEDSTKKTDSDEEGESESAQNNGEDDLSCNFCSKVFTNPTTLANHRKKHGPGVKTYNCDQCDRIFVYKESLDEHLKDDHSGPSAEKSKKAEPKKKKGAKQPKKQTKTTKQNENYTCDECGKEFKWKTSYEDHMAIHEQKFVCKVCSKVFAKKIVLDNHEMTHNQDGKKKRETRKTSDDSSFKPNDENESDINSEELDDQYVVDDSNLRRSKRMKHNSLDGDGKRMSPRKKKEKVNYALSDNESEGEPAAVIVKKKRAKMNANDMALCKEYKIEECFVKLEKMSSEVEDGLE